MLALGMGSPEEIRDKAEKILLIEIKDCVIDLLDSSTEDDDDDEKTIYLDQEVLSELWEAVEKYELFEATLDGVH